MVTKRSRWLTGGAALAVGLAACGPVKVQTAGVVAERPANVITFEVEEEVQPSRVPDVGNGRSVYARAIDGRSCASCHGAQGEPVVAGAPDFRTADWVRQRTPLELEEFLTTGPGHRYRDALSLQERWDVLAWCRYLSVDIEQIRDTKTAAFGKNCNVCHGNRGDGNGFLSPTMQPKPRNLGDYKFWGALRTDQDMFDNIWYGVHWSAMPPWRGTLTEEEVWQLVDYVRSLHYVAPDS